jgi:hypothetical protein
MDTNDKEDLNISQKKMYQRLVGILPDLDPQEKAIIHELLVQHIIGISEEDRIRKILSQLDIEVESIEGSDTT